MVFPLRSRAEEEARSMVEDGSWSSRVVDQGEFDPWNVEWNACVYFKGKKECNEIRVQ